MDCVEVPVIKSHGSVGAFYRGRSFSQLEFIQHSHAPLQ